MVAGRTAGGTKRDPHREYSAALKSSVSGSACILSSEHQRNRAAVGRLRYAKTFRRFPKRDFGRLGSIGRTHKNARSKIPNSFPLHWKRVWGLNGRFSLVSSGSLARGYAKKPLAGPAKKAGRYGAPGRVPRQQYVPAIVSASLVQPDGTTPGVSCDIDAPAG